MDRITGVAQGDYMIEVRVNPDGHIEEKDDRNNLALVPVHIGPDVDGGVSSLPALRASSGQD